jgi:thymidylate kinase
MTIRTRILPLLKQGIWVLCDRYLYTALAELLAVGCSRKDMESVMVVASLFPAPDLAILTDVSANEAIRRIRQRPAEWNARINRMLFGRIVQAFRRVGEENGLVLVSTENTPEEVFETFRPRLDDLINDWEDKLLNTGETGRWGTDR